MPSLSLDIFKKDVHGNPIWLDAVRDLDAARLRLSQLASVTPGEYFAFDQNIHQIVASVVRSDSDRIGGRNDVRLRNEMPALRWDST